MAKKITAIKKLQLPAGKATAGPPVGTNLGQFGINLGEFCSKFNEATKAQEGDIIPVEITIYEDRTFSLIFKTPPASDLLRKAAAIEKGAANPLTTKVGKVSKAKVREIAERKMEDLNANDLEAAIKIIEGTARSMGIEIE
jgi:large subunit ribosomal protein L11